MEDWQKRLEEGETIIRRFHPWLNERKIALINDQPIDDFNDFMSVCTDRGLEQVTPSDLKWFLYDFYIRKCNPNVDPLTPLSFFFQFLEQKGVIKNSLSFRYILENKVKYHKRVRSYPSKKLPDSRWQEQNYEWGLRMNDEIARDIVRDKDVENIPSLNNFTHILKYVKENEVRLTPAKSYFRLTDILRIEEGFVQANRPLTSGIYKKPDSIRSEGDCLYFYYLDTMARVAKYLRKRKNRLHLTAKGRHFLNLSPSGRYLRLFCIYWQEINWNFFYDDRILEEFQLFQQDLECIFRDFLGNDEVPVKSFIDTVLSELDVKPTTESGNYFNLFARYALECGILNWLEELGIITCRHKKCSNEITGAKIIKFQFTPLGRKIIDYFFAYRSNC